MTNTATCPDCAAPIPAGSVLGMCPNCLLRTTSIAARSRVLGEYELLGELGRGGMGVVHRARHREHGTEAAVKLLRGGDFASDNDRRRFRAEAAAAARLDHPGIVRIYDSGEHEGELWFAMELLPGRTLAELTTDGPVVPRLAAKLAHKVASAVAHAHANGVLHRDLKPANILIDDLGQTRVTDFGIARRTRTTTTGGGVATASESMTMTGQVLGSPGYAAPEQLHGERADARTDVYGIGAVLYHLLTGRAPFEGPTLEAILLQIREHDPVSPRRLNFDVPRDLEIICLRCIASERGLRYESAAAVAADLQRHLDGEKIVARPQGTARRLLRWFRRRPMAAAAAMLAALLIVAVIGGALAFARHKSQSEHRTTLLAHAREQRELALNDSRASAFAALREAWVIAPGQDIRSEMAACLAQPELVHEGKVDAKPPKRGGSADGKRSVRFENSAVVVFDTATGAEFARITGFGKPPTVKLDDRGGRIAIIRSPNPKSPGEVTVHELPSGKLLRTLAHSVAVISLDWAGHLIAVGGTEDYMVHVWNADTGERIHRLSGHNGYVKAVCFRPGGQELVSIAHDHSIRVWHAARGAELLRVEGPDVHTDGWWSADGARLFVRSQEGVVESWKATWPRSVRVFAPGPDEPHPENMLVSAAFSSDGAMISTVDERAAHVWSLRDGRVVATVPKTGAEWMHARFSGSDLWLSGWNRALRRVPFAFAENGWVSPGAEQHSGFDSGPLLVAASPDGNWLALTNDQPDSKNDFILLVDTRTLKIRSIPHTGPFSAAFSPDGKWLVTGGYQDSSAKVWSLPDAKLQTTIETPGSALGLAFAGGELWVTGSRGIQRVATGDWRELSRTVEREWQSFAIAPNAAIAATLSRNEVILHRTPDLAELARLPTPPHAGRAGAGTLIFSADSQKLALHTVVGSLLVWDIPALRAELGEMAW